MHALRGPTWGNTLRLLKKTHLTLVAPIMTRCATAHCSTPRYTEKFTCPGYGWIHTMSRRLLRPSGWRAPQARRFGVLVRKMRGNKIQRGPMTWFPMLWESLYEGHTSVMKMKERGSRTRLGNLTSGNFIYLFVIQAWHLFQIKVSYIYSSPMFYIHLLLYRSWIQHAYFFPHCCA
jgi:hypothetical protein